MSCEEGASRLDADVTKDDKLATVRAAYKADMALLRAEMTSGFAQLNSRLEGFDDKLESRMDGLEDKIVSRLEGLEDKIAAKTQLAFKGFENKALVYGVPILILSNVVGVNLVAIVTWLITALSHR